MDDAQTPLIMHTHAQSVKCLSLTYTHGERVCMWERGRLSIRIQTKLVFYYVTLFFFLKKINCRSPF